MGFKPRPPRNKSIDAAPVLAALDRAGGNVSEAARELGQSSWHVYRVLRRAGVARKRRRSPPVLERLLAALDGDVTAVARLLGWSRMRTHRALTRAGLHPAAFRRGTPGTNPAASSLAKYVAARLRLSSKQATLRATRLHLEHIYALAALAQCDGDPEATGRLLDISYSSLKEKVRPPSGSDD